MKITEIRVNHLKELLGFQLTDLRISFKIQFSKVNFASQFDYWVSQVEGSLIHRMVI